MKFLSILKGAGHGLEIVAKDTEIGIGLAQPIISAIPGLNVEIGPILGVVEQLLIGLTSAGLKPNSAQISQITQTVAQHQAISQAAGTVPPPQSGVYLLTPQPATQTPKGS